MIGIPSDLDDAWAEMAAAAAGPEPVLVVSEAGPEIARAQIATAKQARPPEMHRARYERPRSPKR